MQSLQRDTFLRVKHCLLYTSDAADEEDSVDLGVRGIIKKKKEQIKKKKKIGRIIKVQVPRYIYKVKKWK